MDDFRQEFESLFTLERLHRAHSKAAKGKRFRLETARFGTRLFESLQKIRETVLAGTYAFGPYREFVLFDSKRRKIAVSPYPDRVVHWVLYEHLSPLFESAFIFDSYGNRKGKGTLPGVARTREFMRSGQVSHVLKIDFSKYFFSILHEVLLSELAKKVTNPYLFDLLRKLVSSYRTRSEFDHLFATDSPYRTTVDKGMPIWSLTSQLFANVYLNRLDHFAKDFLRIGRYVRYVDDIAVFGGSKSELWKHFEDIRDFSHRKLGLTIHPGKVSVFPKTRGIDFLGYRIWPYRTLPRKRTQKKIRDAIAIADARTLPSYYGIVKHSDSHIVVPWFSWLDFKAASPPAER